MIRCAFLIFICIPAVVFGMDCGMTPEVPKKLRDKYSNSPWNVAVFDLNREEPVQICGGTIISEYLVISAAHCFYNELTKTLRKPSNYEIVVSKISRKYNEKDNSDTQWYKLQEIHVQNSYHEWRFFQTSDIVILETINPIILKSTVAPACIAWDRNNRIELQTGNFGKGLSWGAFTDEEILHEIDLPYSGYLRCLSVVPPLIKPYITLDKFCIENVTDHSVRLGDAGSGFFWAKNFRCYLVGVISIRTNVAGHSIVGCTDIYYHLDWISNIHKIVQKRTTDVEIKRIRQNEELKLKIQAESTSIKQLTKISKNRVTPTPKSRITESAIESVVSSELSEELNSELETVINKVRTNMTGCQLPVNITGRNFMLKCLLNDDCHYSNFQQIVPQFTTLTVTCDKDYVYEDEDPSSICYQGVWKPIIANCLRMCKKLNPVNVVLACFLDGKEVNCDGNMKAGMQVYPKCLPAYIPQGTEPDYREIVCQDDGEWDNILFTCIPECGVPHVSGLKLIKGGVTSEYGDSPWHVAIYNIKSHTLICGGTIISPYLIISAAHCFFDEATKSQEKSVDFEIVVSKVKRDYFYLDNDDTKAYKVKQIYFESMGYRGVLTNYANDIAILQTAEKISLRPTVRTACIEWTRYEKFNPPDGTPGKVVGWGINDDEAEGSEILLSTELPYISYGKCVDIAPPGFKQYITLDKFCAGNTTGPSVTKGDIGGGFMFNVRSLYYLYGVVSIKPNYNTSLAAFTDISDHIEWINKVRNAVEKQIIRENSNLSNQKTIKN